MTAHDTNTAPARAADPWSAKIAAAPWVVSSYFAEGLPYSIVRQVSSQFFTAMGVPLHEISATALYGLAWNLKLLWSPLVDRYGSARRWLLVMQAALGIAIAAVAIPVGQRDVATVARVLVVVAILAA